MDKINIPVTLNGELVGRADLLEDNTLIFRALDERLVSAIRHEDFRELTIGYSAAKPKTQEFKPGDILKSKRSGRLWRVVVIGNDDSKFNSDYVGVCSAKWHNQEEYVWQRSENFELVERPLNEW